MMNTAQQAKRLRVLDDRIERINRRTDAARRTVEAGEAEVERLLAQRDWLAAAPVEQGDTPASEDVVEPAEQGGGDAVDTTPAVEPVSDNGPIADTTAPAVSHNGPIADTDQARGSLFDDTHPAAQPLSRVE